MASEAYSPRASDPTYLPNTHIFLAIVISLYRSIIVIALLSQSHRKSFLIFCSLNTPLEDKFSTNKMYNYVNILKLFI